MDLLLSHKYFIFFYIIFKSKTSSSQKSIKLTHRNAIYLPVFWPTANGFFPPKFTTQFLCQPPSSLPWPFSDTTLCKYLNIQTVLVFASPYIVHILHVYLYCCCKCTISNRQFRRIIAAFCCWMSKQRLTGVTVTDIALGYFTCRRFVLWFIAKPISVATIFHWADGNAATGWFRKQWAQFTLPSLYDRYIICASIVFLRVFTFILPHSNTQQTIAHYRSIV